jgi:hypothetical protein
VSTPVSGGTAEHGESFPGGGTDERPAPRTGDTAVAPPGAGLVSARVVPRWSSWLLLTLGLLSLPWIATLATFLPSTSQSAHYDIAWAGFDLLLGLLLLRTGWAALHRREQSGLTAAMTGTLLVVDAWFDVLSASHTLEFLTALAMAVCVELPLAALCLWIAGRVDADRVRRERIASAALRRLNAHRPRRRPSAHRPGA